MEKWGRRNSLKYFSAFSNFTLIKLLEAHRAIFEDRICHSLLGVSIVSWNVYLLYYGCALVWSWTGEHISNDSGRPVVVLRNSVFSIILWVYKLNKNSKVRPLVYYTCKCSSHVFYVVDNSKWFLIQMQVLFCLEICTYIWALVGQNSKPSTCHRHTDGSSPAALDMQFTEWFYIHFWNNHMWELGNSPSPLSHFSLSCCWSWVSEAKGLCRKCV